MSVTRRTFMTTARAALPRAPRLLLAILLCATFPVMWRPLGAQTPTVTQIAASWHILVLLSDGTVSALGENRAGQLGRPASAPLRFMPAARVDLPGKAAQVATGDEYASFALLEDGTVWAWGQGDRNILGVRLTGAKSRHVPAQVPDLTGVARITGSRTSVMAVMRNGTVRAWGEMPEIVTGGQRAFPGVATPISIDGLANIVDVVGSPYGGYALTRDGRVYAWGSNLKGSSQRPSSFQTSRPTGSTATSASRARRTARSGSGARSSPRAASSASAATSERRHECRWRSCSRNYGQASRETSTTPTPLAASS
jgi:alpha-tubulin suppressor-like RCC1 family protein